MNVRYIEYMQSNEIEAGTWVTTGLKITHYATEILAPLVDGSHSYTVVALACGSRLMPARTANERNVQCPKCRKALKALAV